MSERPTSETDAFFGTFADGEATPSHAEYYDRMTKLERERDAERSLSNQLAGALMVTRWDSYTICKEAIFAWKEARGE